MKMEQGLVDNKAHVFKFEDQSDYEKWKASPGSGLLKAMAHFWIPMLPIG